MNIQLKEAIKCWVDTENLPNMQFAPAIQFDHNTVVETAPLKREMGLFLNIRTGDTSICCNVLKDGSIRIACGEIPDESHIHYNNHYEIICVLDGSFRYNMINHYALLHAGDFMIMDTRCIYWDKKVEEDSIVLCIALSPAFFLKLVDQIPESTSLSYLTASQLDTHMKEQRYVRFHVDSDTEVSHQVSGILTRILEEQKMALPDYQKIQQVYAKRLLIALTQNGNPQQYKVSNGRKESELLLHLEHYIMEHLAEVTREELAETFHYNLHYFNKLLQKSYGLTLKQYIQKKRLSEAKRLLLSSELPIHQIIEQAGYKNRHFFNQLFYEDTGMTPFDFRQQYQNLPASEGVSAD